MELLRVEGVWLDYFTNKEVTNALQDVNFTIEKGEFVSVVGPSGCGKTTILSLIGGLIAPTKGKILLNGKELEPRCGSVGYMLQRDHLFEWRNIKRNIELGLEVQKKKDALSVDFAARLMEKYGLKEFSKHFPNQLSGGMRQRAALIRTLVTNPDLLLLDEPFSALDYQTRLKVCDDVSSIIRGEGKTALMVSHDIAEAISLSSRIIVLSKRPATVKADYRLNFKTDIPLHRREDASFAGWFDKIWRDLA